MHENDTVENQPTAEAGIIMPSPAEIMKAAEEAGFVPGNRIGRQRVEARRQVAELAGETGDAGHQP